MTGKSWSLAGAARFAREARTSTVAHMRTAPIARELRKVKMTRAYDIHLANFGSRRAAMDMLFGGLGYPPPYPAGWDEAAELLTRDEARYLADADLYVITPQMCDVVVAAAQSLAVEDLQLLDEDDLPSPTGLLVLPHPLLVRSVGGDLVSMERPARFRFIVVDLSWVIHAGWKEPLPEGAGRHDQCRSVVRSDPPRIGHEQERNPGGDSASG